MDSDSTSTHRTVYCGLLQYIAVSHTPKKVRCAGEVRSLYPFSCRSSRHAGRDPLKEIESVKLGLYASPVV
jgi:hypothetical protein